MSSMDLDWFINKRDIKLEEFGVVGLREVAGGVGGIRV